MVGFGELADPADDSAGSASDLDLRQDLGWVVALVLLAWLVRLGTFVHTSVIVNDGPTFLGIAQKMLDGNWFGALSAHQHPGYPLVTAGLSHWVGDLQTAGEWVSLVAGSLSVAALYFFLIQAWNRRVAVFGAFLLAINAYAARLSADLQSDSLYLLLFLSSIGLLFRALRSQRTAWVLGAGLVSGLAYCVRPEGLGVVVVGFALSLASWLRGTWTTRTFVSWLGTLCSGAAIIMLPYLLFLMELTGSFTLSQKKSVLLMLGWTGNQGRPSALTASAPSGDVMAWLGLSFVFGLVVLGGLIWIRRGGLARFRVGPTALFLGGLIFVVLGFWVTPSQAADLLAVVISTLRPEVAVLVAIGIVSRSRVDPSARSLFVVTVLSLYALVFFALLLSYGYVVRRHVLPPLSLLLGYAGAGAWVLVGWVEAGFSRRGGLWARLVPHLSLLLVALITVIALPKVWHDHRSEQVASRRAAEWMAAEVKGEGIMASDRMKHGWYAQREWRSANFGGQPISWSVLYGEGVRWILVESLATDRLEEVSGNVGPEGASFDSVELYRVQDGSRQAAVWELVPH